MRHFEFVSPFSMVQTINHKPQSDSQHKTEKFVLLCHSSNRMNQHELPCFGSCPSLIKSIGMLTIHPVRISNNCGMGEHMRYCMAWNSDRLLESSDRLLERVVCLILNEDGAKTSRRKSVFCCFHEEIVNLESSRLPFLAFKEYVCVWFGSCFC